MRRHDYSQPLGAVFSNRPQGILPAARKDRAMRLFARRFLSPLVVIAALITAGEAAAESAAGQTKEFVSARYKFRFSYPANGTLEERALPARGPEGAGFEVRLSV